MGTLINITLAAIILWCTMTACLRCAHVVTTWWGVGIGLLVVIIMSIALGSVAGRAIALLFLN